MSKKMTRGSVLTLLTLAGMGTALLAGPALSKEEPAAKADDNQCVFARTILDWRALDSRNLVVWAPGRKDAYHVKLSFPLHDLKTHENVAIVDHNGDGRICGYGMDQVVTVGGPQAERATIMGMERLDEAGLASLSEEYKVKLLPPQKDTQKDVPK